MKELYKNEYFKKGLTLFISLSLVIVFYLSLSKFYVINIFIKKTISLFTPFIIGFTIAYLLNPLVKMISNKLNTKNDKVDKILAIIIVYFVIFLVISLFIFLVVPELIKSIQLFLFSIPSYFEEFKELVITVENKMHLEAIPLENHDIFNSTIINTINSKMVSSFENIISVFTLSIYSIIKVFINIILGLIISIYFLIDKEYFKDGLKMFNKMIFKDKTDNVLNFFKTLDLIIGKFFIGRILDGLVIGVISFIFLMLFNYQYALLFAFIIGITNIIPYFGPFIGGIPVSFLILLQSPSKFLPFVIFIIILQQIDGYIIGPALSGRKVGLKSFWVLFSILLFGKLFGVLGMILGVPVFAIIQMYFMKYINEYNEK